MDAPTLNTEWPAIAYAHGGYWVCALAQEFIARHANAMRAHVNGVRCNDVDGLHDMRVASRRLRVVLREFRPVLPKSPAGSLYERARSVTRGLGQARELDVVLGMAIALQGDLDPVGEYSLHYFAQFLRAARAREERRVAKALKLVTKRAFGTDVADVVSGVALARADFAGHTIGRLEKRLDRVNSAHEKWRATRANGDLHQLRIAFKKLRYACEAHASFYSESIAEILAALKQAQNALGDWNDWRTFDYRVRDARAVAPAECFEGLNVLLSRARLESESHRARFEAESEPFFSHDTQRRLREFLGQPARA